MRARWAARATAVHGRGAARGGVGDGSVRGAGGGSDATRERTAAGAGERRLGEREEVKV